MSEKVGQVYIEASIDTAGAIQAGKVISKTADEIAKEMQRIADAAEEAAAEQEKLAQAAIHLAKAQAQAATQSEKAATASQSITQKLQAQRDSVDAYIAALKVENDTLGLNQAELNSYRLAKLAASDAEQKVAANLQAQIDAYRKNMAAVEAAKTQQMQSKNTVDQMIAALKEQAATLGFNARQLVLYKAAQAGASAEDKKAIIQSLNQIDAYRRKEEATRKATAALQANSSATNAAGGSMRSFRGVAQNVGFQLQDVAVQAQMGTNALVIAGQQGSQFLSGFGAWGALAGAVLAVASALGYSLAPAFMDSTTAAERLDKSIASLDKVLSQTSDGVTVFKNEIADLAKVSEALAMAQVISGLVNAKTAIKEAGKAIKDEFGGADTSFGPLGTSIDDAIQKFDSIKKRVQDYGSVSRKEIQQQNEFYIEFGKNLGATEKQAEALGATVVSALSNLKNTGDVAAFEASFAALVNQYGASNQKLAEINAKVSEFFSKARTATEAVEFFTSAQKDLGKALSTGTSQMQSAITSLSQSVAIQNKELTAGKAAADALAIAFSLGKTSVEQLDPAVQSLIATLRSGQGELAGREILSALDDQFIKLTMNTDAYEEYAAVKNADAVGATPAQVAAIRSKIKALQDERAAIQANVDLQAEVDENVKFEDEEKKKIRTEFESVQSGIRNELETPAQKAKRELDERLSVIQEYYGFESAENAKRTAEGIAAETAYQKRLTEIKKGEDEQRKAQNVQMAQSAADTFGILADIAKEGGKKSFDQWKIFASAQAAISAALAITNALTLPPPFGFIAAGAIGAATAVQIAKINSAQYTGGGRLYGGPVQAGGMYPVTEDGRPEILKQGNRQYLLPGAQGGEVISNRDMQPAGGGGGITINYNPTIYAQQTDFEEIMAGQPEAVLNAVRAGLAAEGRTF